MAILGHLGAILGHLGPSWGGSWVVLGHLGAHLGRSWAILGPSWVIFGHLGLLRYGYQYRRFVACRTEPAFLNCDRAMALRSLAAKTLKACPTTSLYVVPGIALVPPRHQTFSQCLPLLGTSKAGVRPVPSRSETQSGRTPSRSCRCRQKSTCQISVRLRIPKSPPS